MRKLIFTLAVLLFLGNSALAQESALKLGPAFVPFETGLNTYGGTFQYETKLGKKFSLNFNTTYSTKGETTFFGTNGSVRQKASNLAIAPQVRWYPSQALQGFHLGLEAGYGVRFVKLKNPTGDVTIDGNNSADISGFLTGINLGYQKSLSSDWLIGIEAGAECTGCFEAGGVGIFPVQFTFGKAF